MGEMQHGEIEHRVRPVDGDEWDLVTGWKKVLCYMQRAGVKSKIKRGMRRRERRKYKQEILSWQNDI